MRPTSNNKLFLATALAAIASLGTLGSATAIGASYRINPNAKIWGDFSEEFGNSESTNYGGELGLSVSF